MRIRFLKYCPPYVVGDVAVKDDATARALIDRGAAKLYVDPAIEELAEAAKAAPAPKPRKRRAKKVAPPPEAEVADDE